MRWKAQNGTECGEGRAPTGERQEHLDAIVSFAGAGQELDIITIKWTTGDLLEEGRFLLNTQLMF